MEKRRAEEREGVSWRERKRGESPGRWEECLKRGRRVLSKHYLHVLICPPHPCLPQPPSTSLPTEPKRLPPLLRRAWYGLNQSFRQRIAHLEITPDQFSILRWLIEGDPQGLTQRTLTDLMASDPNTITSTLSRMEAAGLVSRHAHELDRRARRVRVLATGKRTFERAKKVALELQDQVLDALPPPRRKIFLDELECIAEACAAAGERVAKKRGA